MVGGAISESSKSHLKWVKHRPQEQNTWAQPEGHPSRAGAGPLFAGCSWELWFRKGLVPIGCYKQNLNHCIISYGEVRKIPGIVSSMAIYTSASLNTCFGIVTKPGNQGHSHFYWGIFVWQIRPCSGTYLQVKACRPWKEKAGSSPSRASSSQAAVQSHWTSLAARAGTAAACR